MRCLLFPSRRKRTRVKGQLGRPLGHRHLPGSPASCQGLTPSGPPRLCTRASLCFQCPSPFTHPPRPGSDVSSPRWAGFWSRFSAARVLQGPTFTGIGLSRRMQDVSPALRALRRCSVGHSLAHPWTGGLLQEVLTAPSQPRGLCPPPSSAPRDPEAWDADQHPRSPLYPCDLGKADFLKKREICLGDTLMWCRGRPGPSLLVPGGHSLAEMLCMRPHDSQRGWKPVDKMHTSPGKYMFPQPGASVAEFHWKAPAWCEI